MEEKDHTSLDIENLLAQPWGRRFLRRVLFQHTQVFASPHHPEPNVAAYQAGRHAVGLLLLGEIIEADPTAVAILLTEENTSHEV